MNHSVVLYEISDPEYQKQSRQDGKFKTKMSVTNPHSNGQSAFSAESAEARCSTKSLPQSRRLTTLSSISIMKVQQPRNSGKEMTVGTSTCRTAFSLRNDS